MRVKIFQPQVNFFDWGKTFLFNESPAFCCRVAFWLRIIEVEKIFCLGIHIFLTQLGLRSAVPRLRPTFFSFWPCAFFMITPYLDKFIFSRTFCNQSLESLQCIFQRKNYLSKLQPFEKWPSFCFADKRRTEHFKNSRNLDQLINETAFKSTIRSITIGLSTKLNLWRAKS